MNYGQQEERKKGSKEHRKEEIKEDKEKMDFFLLLFQS